MKPFVGCDFWGVFLGVLQVHLQALSPLAQANSCVCAQALSPSLQPSSCAQNMRVDTKLVDLGLGTVQGTLSQAEQVREALGRVRERMKIQEVSNDTTSVGGLRPQLAWMATSTALARRHREGPKNVCVSQRLRSVPDVSTVSVPRARASLEVKSRWHSKRWIILPSWPVEKGEGYADADIGLPRHCCCSELHSSKL
eukprot:3317623-Amphidinium_carterae.1